MLIIDALQSPKCTSVCNTPFKTWLHSQHTLDVLIKCCHEFGINEVVFLCNFRDKVEDVNVNVLQCEIREFLMTFNSCTCPTFCFLYGFAF